MPLGFDFPHHRVDLWMPMPGHDLQKRETRVLWFAFGRIADGVTLRSAQAEMDTIGRRLEGVYPLTNQDVHPRVVNFHEAFIGPNAAEFYGAIWGAVGFVLLIACANLANLQLARAIGRFREISVRIALGAGRARIIRQLVVESIMLSSIGGVFGWLIAVASVRAYELLANPPSSYDHWDFALDHRVVFYLVAISIATGLLFGIAPALRVSKLDSGGREKSLSRLLVTAEMALAAVRLPAARYPRAQVQAAFFDRLITRLKSIPGVNSVALADSLPGLYAPRLPFEIADRPVTLSTLVVGPDYFRILGAAVLVGREFNGFDGPSGMPVAMVNERFVSEFWPGKNPLGKRFRLLNVWRTVVGVASNIIQNDNTGQTFDPVVYLPYSRRPAADMDVLARTGVPPGSLESAFRHEIQAIDSELVIHSGLFNAPLFLIFSAIAFLLAAVGLYAVIAHSVSQRTQEIRIRMAVGATARDILKLVFLQGMVPLGIGLAIGLAGAFAITRILKAELLTVTSAVLVLCAVRVDPVLALRHEYSHISCEDASASPCRSCLDRVRPAGFRRAYAFDARIFLCRRQVHRRSSP